MTQLEEAVRGTTAVRGPEPHQAEPRPPLRTPRPSGPRRGLRPAVVAALLVWVLVALVVVWGAMTP